MMILVGGTAVGACAHSAAGRSARTRQRNLLFINVTSQVKNQKTHICERRADVGHQQMIGRQKRRADYSSAPKSRAVPLEREVAREELRLVTAGCRSGASAICKSNRHSEPPFPCVLVTANHVENVVAVDHSSVNNRTRRSLTVAPIYGHGRREAGSSFAQIIIGKTSDD